MAIPAAALAAKAAVALALDKRTWKAVGAVLLAVLSPFIAVLGLGLGMMSYAADSSAAMIEILFHGGTIPDHTPEELRSWLEQRKKDFESLDAALGELPPARDAPDEDWMKSVYLALFSQEDSGWNQEDFHSFVLCFVRVQEGEQGPETVFMTEKEEQYRLLEQFLGREITEEERQAAQEIYQQAHASLPSSDPDYADTGGTLASPIGPGWQSSLTSDFVDRINPVTGKPERHKGLDIAAPNGTPIHAAADGVVSYVRTSLGSTYGYHIILDHGGGLTTLYAHCSRILLPAGTSVKRGDSIALVGSTGQSTGNHVHFEVREDGVRVDPKPYL